MDQETQKEKPEKRRAAVEPLHFLSLAGRLRVRFCFPLRFHPFPMALNRFSFLFLDSAVRVLDGSSSEHKSGGKKRK